jgi:hypothetical protein
MSGEDGETGTEDVEEQRRSKAMEPRRCRPTRLERGAIHAEREDSACQIQRTGVQTLRSERV